MTAPVLDTHVWVWWMLGDPRLSAQAVDRLDGFPADDRPVLSEISLWEVATLVDLGRLRLEIPLEEWLRVAASPAVVELQRVDPGIVVEMNRLPDTFHRDPADRLIAATARHRKRALATADRCIIAAAVAEIWDL